LSTLAQGFIEVTGYVAAVEAADAMAKAASVKVRRVHKVDGPCVCIICEGDVAACQAALDAAASLCGPKGTLLAQNLIPNPLESDIVHEMLEGINVKKAAKKQARLKEAAERSKAAAAKDKAERKKPATSA